MGHLATWMGGYLRAWVSNDPAEIGELFADDAAYYTAPSRTPWQGRKAIVEGWLHDRDEPGEFTFQWQPLVESDGLGVITGRTVYKSGDDFDNLWVVEFDDDGRCAKFTEWYMARERSA